MRGRLGRGIFKAPMIAPRASAVPRARVRFMNDVGLCLARASRSGSRRVDREGIGAGSPHRLAWCNHAPRMDAFTIDPDIRRARSLPAAAYTDDALFRRV